MLVILKVFSYYYCRHRKQKQNPVHYYGSSCFNNLYPQRLHQPYEPKKWQSVKRNQSTDKSKSWSQLIILPGEKSLPQIRVDNLELEVPFRRGCLIQKELSSVCSCSISIRFTPLTKERRKKPCTHCKTEFNIEDCIYSTQLPCKIGIIPITSQMGQLGLSCLIYSRLVSYLGK